MSFIAPITQMPPASSTAEMSAELNTSISSALISAPLISNSTAAIGMMNRPSPQLSM